jgi:hypothetical protein
MWQMLAGMAAKKAMSGKKEKKEPKRISPEPGLSSAVESTKLDDDDSTVRPTEYSSTKLDKPEKKKPYAPRSTRLD